VASTAFVLVAALRRRADELAALDAVGVHRSVLQRAVLSESLVVVLSGVVAGLVAGVLALVVALPSIPEFIGLSPGPPLDYGLPFGVLGLALVVVLAALVVTVALTGLTLVGRSVRTAGTELG
jgi:ABC-type antimicrobial peptide transport system permease subunit